MSILIGNGDGSFQSAVTYSSSASYRFEVFDVNNDGYLDLVGGDTDDDTISVFLGDGEGNFDNRITSVGPVETGSVAVGDYDGDGFADLVTGNQNSNIYYLHGNGDGTFATATILAGLSSGEKSFASGDLNGDGNLDLISRSGGPSFVAFLGDGHGGFVVSDSGSPGASFGSPTLADMDGDGRLDLVGVDGTLGSVLILLGQGNGTFGAASTIPAGATARSVAVADLDGDGFLDIVNTNRDPTNTISVRLQHSHTVSAVSDLNIQTQESAQNTLEILDTGMTNLLNIRTSVGVQMNRLQYTDNFLRVGIENLESAKSQILDADIAHETAELTKQQILQQASMSVLSQSNLSLQIVLDLLKF